MVSVQDCCLKNFVKHHTKSLSYDGDVLNINQCLCLPKPELNTRGRLGSFLEFKSVHWKTSDGGLDHANFIKVFAMGTHVDIPSSDFIKSVTNSKNLQIWSM